jgi:hypothetical protein
MLVNADFSIPAISPGGEQDWICSPEGGVDRIMLDRIGDEVARATSIVRYRPGSRFSRHEHALGEEFLVLDGVFSDEHGDYPPGTYVRNPPGSGHSPFSREGCRILVKLRQFDRQDLEPVVIDTTDQRLWSPDDAGRTSHMALHQFGTEQVQMLRLPEACDLVRDIGDGGIELFVVSGAVTFDDLELTDDSWLRLPEGSHLHLRANRATTLWVKSGHLPEAPRST